MRGTSFIHLVLSKGRSSTVSIPSIITPTNSVPFPLASFPRHISMHNFHFPSRLGRIANSRLEQHFYVDPLSKKYQLAIQLLPLPLFLKFFYFRSLESLFGFLLIRILIFFQRSHLNIPHFYFNQFLNFTSWRNKTWV